MAKITRQGLDNLIKQLEELEKNREGAIITINDMKAQGDLRENYGFQIAKDQKETFDKEIADIKNRIASSIVVDIAEEAQNNTKVSFGRSVTIMDLDRKTTKKYTIVGEGEADPDFEGTISETSPLAEAMMGKKLQEEFVFYTPTKMTRKYRILSIE